MRPRIFPDGTQWCALLGDDLQTGIVGFGTTPEAAAADFDAAWRTAKTPPIAGVKGNPLPVAHPEGCLPVVLLADVIDPPTRGGKRRCVMPQRPITPTPSEAQVQAIEQHINGWKSATFGWQDDPNPVVARQNMIAAFEEHAAECLRRIRVTLGVGGTFNDQQEQPK